MITPRVSVVIPALNEEESLPLVLREIPADLVTEVVVADNGSTDGTARVAREAGARVVPEPERGYGSACLAGIAATDRPDIVAFLDADYSDHPAELRDVLAPLLEDRADLVIGSRMTGAREPGALLPQALFGNWLATFLIRIFWGVRFTDLGPFRAVRADALRDLEMADRDFGWTVEMQVKAARAGLRCVEVPVSYRKRVGKSKITGTIRGTVLASHKILSTIFRSALRRA
ncbi:MAG: glycosyltransferase family 2 protein [Gemmatimonadetes bacterium]|nr:glycosyltransferase family 2 protein [Gemmatimonadota bacterium]